MNSGADLRGSDLFFNCFKYDFLSVAPNEDLGITNDFLTKSRSLVSRVSYQMIHPSNMAASNGLKLRFILLSRRQVKHH
jgi:hypothetical protein